ncbi:MAG: teichoic acid biosynthesis protein [Myxococcales bacterium]|nr:teichoic acid biosynthesis protein [Myxococcales bacterium]
MRILYGVVGEGMGHAMRSRVVIAHLLAGGHEVEILASGRAVDFLSKHFGGVSRIHGLHIITEDNRVRLGKTVWSNAVAGATGLPRNIASYFELIERFTPELVLADFESWTYLYGKVHRLPVLSIDNMQIINRCRHDQALFAGEAASFRLTRAFVKSKLPGCSHYLITTFFRPEVRKKRTTLVPPILRPEILAAQPSRGEHLLVYQTSEGHDTLVATLRELGVPCRVYGLRRELTRDVVEGNLTYRPFSEAGFIADLASARAVIAGGGFTLMGECVYLHKPMLSVPIEKQFEQVMNARYLEREGFGKYAATAEDPDAIRGFLAELPRFEAALAGYAQDGNRELYEAVDHHLDRAAAGLH